MQYSELEVYNYLTSSGASIDSYVVILGKDGLDDILYSIHENILFVEIIEDNIMYAQCISYIKKKGSAFNDKNALKLKFPNLICS